MNKLIALLMVLLASVIIISPLSIARDFSSGPLTWEDMHPRENKPFVETKAEASPQPVSSFRSEEEPPKN